MANRFIESNMWNDSKFADDFTPEDKYFWLMLLTTRYGNLAGCFEFSIKQMARDSGYNTETIERILSRFIKEYKMIDYDYETKEILIFNWYKYNWTKSPKFKISLDKFINQIKNSKFKDYVKTVYEQYSIDTVSIQYRYDTNTTPNTNTISNTNTKDKNKNIETKKRFVAPTQEEVFGYLEKFSMTEEQKILTGKMFYNHFENNGWKVSGKTPMKDWRLALNNWALRDGYTEKEELPQVKEEVNDCQISDEEYEELLKKMKEEM